MTQQQDAEDARKTAVERFQSSSQALASFAEGDPIVLDLNDSAGRPAVKASRAQFGGKVIQIYDGYFRQHFAVGASVEELSVVNWFS